MLPVEILLFLSLTPITAHVIPIPFRSRDLPAPVLPGPGTPLESVANSLLSAATSTDGLFTIGPEATTLASSPDPLKTGPTSSQKTTGTRFGTDHATATGTATGTAATKSSSSGSDTDPEGSSSIGTRTGSAAAQSTLPGPSSGSGSGSGSTTTNSANPTTTGDSRSSGNGNNGGEGGSSSTSGSDPNSTDPSSSNPNSSSDPSSPSSSSTNHGKTTNLSTGEVVVAVILPVFGLLVALFLLLRFCPPFNKKYREWRQKRLNRSAYRRALNDPLMSFHPRSRIPRPFSFGFSTPSTTQQIESRPLNGAAAARTNDSGSRSQRQNNKTNGSTGGAIGVAVPMPVSGKSRHGHNRSISHARTMSSISEESEGLYEDARSERGQSPERNRDETRDGDGGGD
ncbi:hypothetical protein LTS17_005744 [Exophiala oligosperma]